MGSSSEARIRRLHYQTGNYKARRRYVALEEILKSAGFDEKRVWLRWISASEAKIRRVND